MGLPHGTEGGTEGPGETGLPSIIAGLLPLTPPLKRQLSPLQTWSPHAPMKLLRGRCDYSPRAIDGEAREQPRRLRPQHVACPRGLCILTAI